MKKLYSLLLFYPLLLSLNAQPNGQEQTTTFIKVWGFLKYYHPALADGKPDWDNQFIKGINHLSNISTNTAMNKYLIDIIDQLGQIASCRKCNDTMPGDLTRNLDIGWINDKTLFVPELVTKLNNILNNRNQKQNHYAYLKRVALVVPYSGPTFENEKAYHDSVFPSLAMRMLTLARYWNIINYYYPYKYALDEDWNKVLVESVNRFITATDTLSYHLAILNLTTKINDSHSSFSTPQIRKFLGERDVSFAIRFIEDQPIVDYTRFSDPGTDMNDLNKGDIILSVDDQPVANLVKEKLQYMQGSNQPSRLRNLAYWLLKGDSKTVKISFERNGSQLTKFCNRYTMQEQIERLPKPINVVRPKIIPWKIFSENVGYIKMNMLETEGVDEAMQALINTKGLILDLRNYPKSVYKMFGRYLNIEKKPFARLTTPDLNFPGVMKHSLYTYTGQKQSPVYKGKVAVLMNEQTMSLAEFTVMALQTGKDVVTVGSQTAGADGDTRKIPMPGGYTAVITGIGIYYPNGKETQRIGIVPDYNIKPTVAGFRAGKDEVLDYALNLLENL